MSWTIADVRPHLNTPGIVFSGAFWFFLIAEDSAFLFAHHIWLLQGTSNMLCFWAESENLEKFYNHHWIFPSPLSLPCAVELKSEFDTFVCCSRNPANHGTIPSFGLGSCAVELRCYSEKEQLVLPANTSTNCSVWLASWVNCTFFASPVLYNLLERQSVLKSLQRTA